MRAFHADAVNLDKWWTYAHESCANAFFHAPMIAQVIDAFPCVCEWGGTE